MFDLQDYMIVILIWLITIIFLRPIFSPRKRKPRLPPCPPALPILGHMHLLPPILHKSLANLSNRYGPLFYFYIGSKPCLLVSSHELAKEALFDNSTCFLNRPKLANLDYLTYGSADMAMAPYTPLWKFMRKLSMTQLLGTRALDRLNPLRREEIKRFIKILQEKAEAGEAVDIGAELVRLTNNITLRMLLSRYEDEEADQLQKLIAEMNGIVTKVNLSDYLWFLKSFGLLGFRKRLKDVRDRFDILMDKFILEHKEARKKDDGRIKDVLDILIDISEDEDAEMKLTNDNIKGLISNYLTGGTDSFPLMICWGLAELINHPEVMKKAQNEIDSVVGRNRILEESDVENLPYLKAIVKETLRLHPGGPLVVRESTEDCTIGGYDIPGGTTLFVNVWALGKDPKQWENPLEFKPERFLSNEWRQGKQQLLDLRGHNFNLLPFGSGRRSCPGASLALAVVPAVLGIVIQCFDWKVDGKNGRVNMEEKPGIALLRAHPTVCRPDARLSPFPSV